MHTAISWTHGSGGNRGQPFDESGDESVRSELHRRVAVRRDTDQ